MIHCVAVAELQRKGVEILMQRRKVLCVLAALALAACQEKNTLARENWPRGVAEQVDSGNAAYRAANYQEARRHFVAATDRAPRLPVAWFGLYMAEHALGNKAAADSAKARSEELAGRSVGHPKPDGEEKNGSSNGSRTD
jgi:hypothetical protein